MPFPEAKGLERFAQERLSHEVCIPTTLNILLVQWLLR